MQLSRLRLESRLSIFLSLCYNAAECDGTEVTIVFEKLTNSYFYGKSGKGDLRPEDLPANRWELFGTTLRVRFASLVRLNLMYLVVWLPLIVVLAINFLSLLQLTDSVDLGDGTSLASRAAVQMAEDPEAVDPAQAAVISAEDAGDQLQGMVTLALLMLIPCIAITGPATAGVSYVTRNWSRDEHAFIWADFKDAVKANWKQSLAVSTITGFVPALVYIAWRFYGSLASGQPLMLVLQGLVLMIGLVWAISVTYMHPLIVTYDLRLGQILRNALLLSVAKLPMSIGVRLLHALPLLLCAALALLWNPMWAMLILFAYYVLIGFALSRFITASYTNSVFDRYLNPRIAGAKVNQGLREKDPDCDDEDKEVE